MLMHEGLIELTLSRLDGKLCYAQFTCEDCKKNNTIPRNGEGKTIFNCAYCEVTNYLSGYEVVRT